MDDQEFKQRLSQLCDWEYPDVGPIDKDLREDRTLEKDRREFLEQNGGVNPTLAPKIIKIHHEPKPCEDCGRICAKPRRLDHKLIHSVAPHWRTFCNICKCNRHPVTGEFTLGNGQVNYVYQKYLNAKLKSRN